MIKVIKIKEEFKKGFYKYILSLIYPETCGICGKINSYSVCPKCNVKLKENIETKIMQEEIELQDRYFNELMYIFKYEGQIRNLILDYKFNEKTYLYKMFSDIISKNEKIFENAKKYDTIIPVPISNKRFKERGYNQSELIAKEIAKKANLELLNNCLIKTKNIIEQSKLKKDERKNNIKDVYELKNKNLINNKKVLLFDDIYTTGSTVNECSKILRQAEPKKIGVLVIAKD